MSDTLYSAAEWRLIYSDPAPGAYNMALDEAILQAVAAGQVPPTLRFFAWSPACLSLGYAQPGSDVDHVARERLGYHVVRRLTGGRAILHTDELTYSVAIPQDDPRVAGGIVESYRRLSGGLMAGLQHLGLQPYSEKAAAGATRDMGPVCFEVPSHYEITVGGRKLVGSAQVRKLQVVLQHGTLPLAGDIARICDVLVFESAGARAAARERVGMRACTLEWALGQVVGWRAAAEALAQGFAETLNVRLSPAALTPEEIAQAEQLAAAKYGNPDWTARKVSAA